MKDFGLELEVAKKRMNKIISNLHNDGIPVSLLDVDVLDGNELFVSAVIIFGSLAEVERIKARWNRSLQRMPTEAVEVITKMKNMERKILEEHTKWKEEHREMQLIYIGEDGRTYLVRNNETNIMQRLLQGTPKIVPDTAKRSIKPYITLCSEEARAKKRKKNVLASEIVGHNIYGAMVICKEEVDEFGEYQLIGLTRNEVGVWRSRMAKIRNSIQKRAKNNLHLR